MKQMLRDWMAHPLTRGMDVDSPETTSLRRRIVREKPFLRKLYEEWYSMIRTALPDVAGPVLEIGSGAGFMAEFVDGLITSEVFPARGVRVVLDATTLPFANVSLRAIVMTDVFHHIARPRAFLREAIRCLKPGGSVVMIEPWVSGWSSFVYRRFHHEPFDPQAATWEFPLVGPLSGANGALPWIVFGRDRMQMQTEFPDLQIRSIEPLMPVSYLLSGGVGMRSLMPGFAYGLCRSLETGMRAISRKGAMFACIVLGKA